MSRFGGEVVYTQQRDVGAMFDATQAVEKVDGKYIAYVMTGWGGGVKCTKDTETEAIAELPRLFTRMYGDE